MPCILYIAFWTVLQHSSHFNANTDTFSECTVFASPLILFQSIKKCARTLPFSIILRAVLKYLYGCGWEITTEHKQVWVCIVLKYWKNSIANSTTYFKDSCSSFLFIVHCQYIIKMFWELLDFILYIFTNMHFVFHLISNIRPTSYGIRRVLRPWRLLFLLNVNTLAVWGQFWKLCEEPMPVFKEPVLMDTIKGIPIFICSHFIFLLVILTGKNWRVFHHLAFGQFFLACIPFNIVPK